MPIVRVCMVSSSITFLRGESEVSILEQKQMSVTGMCNGGSKTNNLVGARQLLNSVSKKVARPLKDILPGVAAGTYVFSCSR